MPESAKTEPGCWDGFHLALTRFALMLLTLFVVCWLLPRVLDLRRDVDDLKARATEKGPP